MKVYAQRDADGSIRFSCPATGCGKRLRLSKAPSRAITCPNPACQAIIEADQIVLGARPAPAPLPPPVIPRLGPAPTIAPEPWVPPIPAPRLPTSRLDTKTLSPVTVIGLVAGAGVVLLLVAILAVMMLVPARRTGRTTPEIASASGVDPARTATPDSGQSGVPAPAPELKKDREPASSPAATPTPPAPSPPPAAKPVPAPAPTLSPQQLQTTLQTGLQLLGTLTPENVTSYGYQRTEHSHRWVAALTLKNASGVPLDLGSDYFLIESGADEGSFEGFSVFTRAPTVVSPSTYGLGHNSETNGSCILIGNGQMRFSSSGEPPATFGLLTADKPWNLKRDFPQFYWIQESKRTKVTLVLPEIKGNTLQGEKRFRSVWTFTHKGKAWEPASQILVPVEAADLKARLVSPSDGPVLKVMAANWLSRDFPREAGPSLVALGTGLREGQVLATSLLLLRELRAPGLEAHAVTLVGNSGVPNGIRASAARYLGTLHHDAALDTLLKLSADTDRAVSAGAIDALGAFGGPRAIAALDKILTDPNRRDDQRLAADNLARMKAPEAYAILEKRIQASDDIALQALATAGPPEKFEYFVELSKKFTRAPRRDIIAQGLKASGGDRALPSLLDLVQAGGPGTEQDGYGGLISSLTTLNRPEATGRLNTLAAGGNLLAAHALGQSRNDSVWQPLVDLAARGPAPVRRIALNGLAARWATKSFSSFEAACKDADRNTVQAAIQGLQASKDPRAPALLVGLLEHADQQIRQSASYTLEGFKPTTLNEPISQVLLRTSDQIVMSGCARILMAAGWKDKTAIPKIGQKLVGMQDYQAREVILLLRHLSDNAMGPANDQEFYKDPKGWITKWRDWAIKQR